MRGDPAEKLLSSPCYYNLNFQHFLPPGKKRSPFSYVNPAPSSGLATPAGLFWISGQSALHGCTQALRQWLFCWSVLSQHLHFRFFKCTLWLHRTLASVGGFLCTILSAQSPAAPILSLLEMCRHFMGQWFPPTSHLARGNDGFRPRPSVPKSWALSCTGTTFSFFCLPQHLIQPRWRGC